MHFEEPPVESFPSIRGTEIDRLDDQAIDQVPFGVICLDADGVVLRYNLYESRLARLDRNQVLGCDFFNDIARCTRGDAFEGRFRRFVQGSDDPQDCRFEYVFDFAFGAQTVGVELHRVPGVERFYLFVNRKSVGPVRANPRELATAQLELAPNEAFSGVLRDEQQRRIVQVPATFFEALRGTFARLAPENWVIFANEWGTQWGRRAAIELEADSLERTNGSLEDLTMVRAAALVTEYIESQGWGKAEFSFDAANEGVLGIEMVRSALAETSSRSVSGAKTTLLPAGACAMLGGFFSGVLSHMAHKRLVAREVACTARGAPSCTFVMVSADRVSMLEHAVQASTGTVDSVRGLLRKNQRSRR